MATAAVATINPLHSVPQYLHHDNINNLTNEDIRNMIKKMEYNIQNKKNETKRLNYKHQQTQERINKNKDKIKQNATRPYLVSNISEVLDDNSVVLKTSSQQNIFLPIPGLINIKQLTPNDLVGVDRSSYIILDKLPNDYDSRVQTMEIDTKPRETFNDIGGLDEQIKQLIESIVLPIEQKEIFDSIGITSSKGVLLYGPPGTGKTLLGRACANRTNATFLRLSATQLISKYKGDGARIIRDAFNLAKQKAPTIIFIDEIDAIGTKRSNLKKGDEALLQLLNELDGFSNDVGIKIIAATNRIDVLDPALLRSGRMDRKIECPLPNQRERLNILKIHANKMKCDDDVNFEELARSTEDFNGAQLKAVTVETGMISLRKGHTILMHQDFIEGIQAVEGKKKFQINYFM